MPLKTLLRRFFAGLWLRGAHRVTWSGRLVVVSLLVGSLCYAAFYAPVGSGRSVAPPAPPVGVRFELVDRGLKVTWDDIPGATHYTVFWASEKGEFRDLADARTNALVVSGLSPGRLYSFAVSSWSERGESDFSPRSVCVYDNDKGNATAHVIRANELMRQGAFSDADAYLSAAIRLDPDSAEAYRSRAVVNERLERADSARNDYAMAERLYHKKSMSRGRSIN